MNRNPVWKYLLLIAIIVPGLIYFAPNMFSKDFGIQVIGLRSIEVNETTLDKVNDALTLSGLSAKSVKLDLNSIKARFKTSEEQLKAHEAIQDELGDNYAVAKALMPSTPEWLAGMGAEPMYLGLDLQGGVHFLMEVDMKSAPKRAEDGYKHDIKELLQADKIRYLGIKRVNEGQLEIKLKNDEDRQKTKGKILAGYPELQPVEVDKNDDRAYLQVTVTEAQTKEIKKAALKKNMIALRSRIDELGVAEPIVQQQGDSRIVVQLPGVQDPAKAKDIIGKTATLEIKLVDEKNDLQSSVSGRVPPGTKRYYFRDGQPILLKNKLIYSGENIIDATSGFDSQSGGPTVNITLDSKGSAINRKVTGENINKRMAVVYVEKRTETVVDADGNEKLVNKTIEEVITAPVIRDQLGKRFQITGLDSPKESQDLALLLRAGSLAAPVYIVEERTVGPSLGKENIEKGFKSVLYGFLAVLVFMIIYYRIFGGVACFALMLNLVMIVAVLSLFQATLTLPGVAGMVLTVGMAVDANVLIFERIREELRNGATPQAAIHSGYDKAFSTIFDANFTTLIAALMLFNFGTGPIKGFAITLSIGIITSMITAIFVTRVFVNFIYGNRQLEKLAI